MRVDGNFQFYKNSEFLGFAPQGEIVAFESSPLESAIEYSTF